MLQVKSVERPQCVTVNRKQLTGSDRGKQQSDSSRMGGLMWESGCRWTEQNRPEPICSVYRGRPLHMAHSRDLLTLRTADVTRRSCLRWECFLVKSKVLHISLKWGILMSNICRDNWRLPLVIKTKREIPECIQIVKTHLILTKKEKTASGWLRYNEYIYIHTTSHSFEKHLQLNLIGKHPNFLLVLHLFCLEYIGEEFYVNMD